MMCHPRIRNSSNREPDGKRCALSFACAVSADCSAVKFNQITNEEDTRQFLARAAFDPLPGSPDQMSALLKSDAARWKSYVELAKIEPQ